MEIYMERILLFTAIAQVVILVRLMLEKRQVRWEFSQITLYVRFLKRWYFRLGIIRFHVTTFILGLVLGRVYIVKTVQPLCRWLFPHLYEKLPENIPLYLPKDLVWLNIICLIPFILYLTEGYLLRKMRMHGVRPRNDY